MKPASAALMALLDGSDGFVMADLYSFTLTGGEVLRYSAAASALEANGFGFALGPKFERSKTKTVIGTEVDELDIRIYPEDSDRLGDFTFLEAVWRGQFDGALVQVERAFMAQWGDTGAGTVVLFAGRVSDIECGRTQIDIKVRSHLELLNIQMPRRLWQSACTHTFGGAMCQFNRAGMAADFAAGAGSTQSAIVTAIGPNPPTLYDQGTILATAGANAGASRTIRTLADSLVSLTKPFLSPVAAGDAFRLLPGCDHTQASCANVFNNLAHFGGFPYIPTPETAV